MADETPNPSGPFDVRTVEALVGLMTDHDISEIDLRDGARRLRLRRGQRPARSPAAAPAPLQAATALPAATPDNGQAAAPPARKLVEIKSETVGTFYAAPNPESPPFVRLGARVEPTTVVGLIEAMKLFNEIQAGCGGVIAEILVEDKHPVEFGQVLFRVDPSA